MRMRWLEAKAQVLEDKIKDKLKDKLGYTARVEAVQALVHHGENPITVPETAYEVSINRTPQGQTKEFWADEYVDELLSDPRELDIAVNRHLLAFEEENKLDKIILH